MHERTEPCLDCKNKEVFIGKSIYRQWHSSRNKKYYEIYDTLLKHPDGSLAKMAFFHDVTVERQALESLAHNQILFEGIVNNSSAVIYAKDRQGKYLLANNRFHTLFNKEGRDIIGKTDFDFFPEAQAAEFQANDLKVLTDKQVLQIEEVIPHDDGNHIYVSLKFPIVDTDGSIYGIAGISTDITVRQQLEAEGKKTKEQLTALINASPDCICLKDEEGKWIMANNQLLDLLQLTDVEYKGKINAELVQYSDSYREAFLNNEQAEKKAWQCGTLYRYEQTLTSSDGKVRILDVVIVPLFNADGSRKVIVVQGHDITKLRMTEKRLRQEIMARQQAAEVLKEKSKDMEEVNIALRVLVKQQKKAVEKNQQQILVQLEKAVLPYVDLLGQCMPAGNEKAYLDIIRRHLRCVGDAFIKKLDNPDLGLTKREILVADLIRQGKSTKEIATLLLLQPRTVESYRNQIRKKLRLTQKKIKLAQYLDSTFTSTN